MATNDIHKNKCSRLSNFTTSAATFEANKETISPAAVGNRSRSGSGEQPQHASLYKSKINSANARRPNFHDHHGLLR